MGTCAYLLLGFTLVGAPASGAEPVIERVSTAVPFPRGLAVVDGRMAVLARGRVRDAGGVSAQVDDRAGTLFWVDPDVAEPALNPQVSQAVRENGEVLTLPSSPPFRLWDRTADPPWTDRETDRPYCTLRYHAGSRSLILCAFSGIDRAGKPSFSKNPTDALLRYDLRTQRWYELERHRGPVGTPYPHHDPARFPPPHGWLEGPANCLVVRNQLYAVAKDNSVLVRYDLSALVDDPEAGPPTAHRVLGDEVTLDNGRVLQITGHSGLAYHDGWLSLATRTSSHIVRFRLDEQGLPVRPLVPQQVARFAPYDPATGRSANLTDLDHDEQGRLYVISAHPARLYRFQPVPGAVFDGRPEGHGRPWVDLAARLDKPRLKAENVTVHRGYAHVTTGDAYDFQQGADGTIYRLRIDD